MNENIFNREIDPVDRERWRVELASTPNEWMHSDAMAMLAFQCGGEFFACDPKIVESISPLPTVHSLPDSGVGICGFVNSRGNVLLCFSLADVLDCAGSPSDDAMMLVLNDRNWRVAVRVDRVRGLIDAGNTNQTDLPATLSAAMRAHATGFVEAGSVRYARLDSARLFETLNGIARSCLTT